jgi:hypothetical protein
MNINKQLELAIQGLKRVAETTKDDWSRQIAEQFLYEIYEIETNYSVIMLPTDNNRKTPLCFGDNKKYLFNSKELAENWQFVHRWQHLYIVSDDEIKKDDVLYEPILGIGKAVHKYETLCFFIPRDEEKGYGSLLTPLRNVLNCKKVVATTDISTIVRQLSQEFIDSYVYAFNKGNDIEVLYEKEVFIIKQKKS